MATTTPAPPRTKRKTEVSEDEKARARARDLIEKTDANQVGEINTGRGSSPPERKYIVIDDERHDLRLMQDFGLFDHREWTRNAEEFDALFTLDDQLNAKQRKRYEYLADWLFDHALTDSKKLRDQLSGVNPETGDPWLTGTIKRVVISTFSDASAIKSLTQTMMENILQALSEQEEAQGNDSTPTS